MINYWLIPKAFILLVIFFGIVGYETQTTFFWRERGRLRDYTATVRSLFKKNEAYKLWPTMDYPDALNHKLTLRNADGEIEYRVYPDTPHELVEAHIRFQQNLARTASDLLPHHTRLEEVYARITIRARKYSNNVKIDHIGGQSREFDRFEVLKIEIADSAENLQKTLVNISEDKNLMSWKKVQIDEEGEGIVVAEIKLYLYFSLMDEMPDLDYVPDLNKGAISCKVPPSKVWWPSFVAELADLKEEYLRWCQKKHQNPELTKLLMKKGMPHIRSWYTRQLNVIADIRDQMKLLPPETIKMLEEL